MVYMQYRIQSVAIDSRNLEYNGRMPYPKKQLTRLRFFLLKPPTVFTSNSDKPHGIAIGFGAEYFRYIPKQLNRADTGAWDCAPILIGVG